MCSVTKRDRYPCEELRAWVGIKPIDVMRQRRLRWFGHIERREGNSWPKKVQILAVDCSRCHYMNSLMCRKLVHKRYSKLKGSLTELTTIMNWTCDVCLHEMFPFHICTNKQIKTNRNYKRWT